jgi:CxxC motif-containing protein
MKRISLGVTINIVITLPLLFFAINNQLNEASEMNSLVSILEAKKEFTKVQNTTLEQKKKYLSKLLTILDDHYVALPVTSEDTVALNSIDEINKFFVNYQIENFFLTYTMMSTIKIEEIRFNIIMQYSAWIVTTLIGLAYSLISFQRVKTKVENSKDVVYHDT